MAQKLPMGEADNWATPLTQQEADYIWTVLGWAAKKGISLNPVTLLSLPSVSTGTAPIEEDYKQRYAPTVTLYSGVYSSNEVLPPESIIATYVSQGKSPQEIVKIIKDNPDEFPLSTGSKFERSSDYIDFVGDLYGEWQTYQRVFKEDSDKFVTDPYAKLNLPEASKTYPTGSKFANLPQIPQFTGKTYKSTPREDALLLAMARAVDDKYIIPGLQSEMRPTTTVPGGAGGDMKRPPVVFTPEELKIAKQRSQLAKEFAARGLSGNYGLGAGPITGTLTPPSLPGPSRPVVTTTPTIGPEEMRARALASKLSNFPQKR